MHTRLYIEGLNLEKLLSASAQHGIVLRRVRRIHARKMEADAFVWQMKKLKALCSRFGWSLTVVRRGCLQRCCGLIRKRKMLFAGLAMGMMLVSASDGMILAVSIENARENAAQIHAFLEAEGIRRGSFKASFPLDELRAKMALSFPGLSFVGVRYEGSTLIVDCHSAREGEDHTIEGRGNDIIASRPGIVTRIYVQSGTPAVSPGQAVRQGQILICGEERTQKGQSVAVRAQGQVNARVWSRGDARVSLWKEQHVETGRERRKVTLCTPWSRKTLQDAAGFDSQDVHRETQRIAALYLPVWREIETYMETIVHRVPVSRADAASLAQGAAQEIAKNGCPYDALILDKWVDYSMIDNEFVYATVVLEYETSIASRLDGR